jgi:death-on-curing protein
MIFLDVEDVRRLHTNLLRESGGLGGVRDLGGLESAVAQPQMTFGGADLYPTLVEKASALGFSLVKNHPFLDGNKRIGHAAAAVFLDCNGFKIDAPVDEQEAVIQAVAAGRMKRDEFTDWLTRHVVPRS